MNIPKVKISINNKDCKLLSLIFPLSKLKSILYYPKEQTKLDFTYLHGSRYLSDLAKMITSYDYNIWYFYWIKPVNQTGLKYSLNIQEQRSVWH